MNRLSCKQIRRGWLCSAVLVLSSSGLLFSQSPDEFNPGADYLIETLALQADGRILVGGSFGALGGQVCSALGRLNEDGSYDSTFVPHASGNVISLAVQPNGRILVGGYFSSLGGQTRNNIARLHNNGALDYTFNPGANNTVCCLALQADGKILVGGNFSTLGGQSRACIGRMNSDGSLDTSFNPGAGSDVYALAVQPDGKILVGGVFTTLGGQARNYLGRLNANGTLDSAFNPGADNTVLTLAVLADGKIMVGGKFATLGGQTRNYLGRLNSDGTLDTTFTNLAIGPAAVTCGVYSLVVQSDAKILASGLFDTVGGQTRNSIVRLNADGTVDGTFDSGASYTVNALALQSDGKVLAAGQFTSLGGQSRQYLGRLNNSTVATQELAYDGLDITWLRGGCSPEVWRTAFEATTNGNDWFALGVGQRISGGWKLDGATLEANTTIRARGFVTAGRENGSAWYFEAIRGPPAISQPPLSCTNNAGTTASFRVWAGGSPLTYQWHKDGAPLADGGQISGVMTATLILSNVFGADAGGYSVTVSNSSGCVTSSVAALTVLDPFITTQPANRAANAGQTVTFSVTAGGTAPLAYRWRKGGTDLLDSTNSSLTLTNVQWSDRGSYDVRISNPLNAITSSVATLTVSLTYPDSLSASASSDVQAVAVLADGNILVGGRFTTIGGYARSHLARLSSSGAVDTNFNVGTTGGTYPSVSALAVQSDGKILIGGDFTAVNGQTRTNLARLNPDGTLDASFDPRAGGVSSSAVSALAVQSDGKILVGGWFTSLGGQNRSNIGRLNPDGSLDSSFNPGASGSYPRVYTIALQSDGKILVGGTFTSLAGQSRGRIGRLNSNGSIDASWNPGADSSVFSLAVQGDGKIVVGGLFSTLRGQSRNNLGRLNANGTLDTTFNPGAGWSVFSIAPQTDGKLIVGGAFTTLAGQPCSYLGRLNGDGSLDPTFGSTTSGYVNALAIQPDGRILVGGNFFVLGNQLRNNFGRLVNSEPATQNLLYDGATVTWQRAGTSPELLSANFNASTNGTDWFSLGVADYSTGAWQLTGVTLPTGSTVGARGMVAGGYHNGSGWWTESISGSPFITTQPASRTNGAGTVATFTILAAGSPSLSYQWSKDGVALGNTTNISGAQAATMTLSNVLAADAGAYTVIVSNPLGSVTSAVAMLTVIDPFVAVSPSLTTNLGKTIAFSATAAGTFPLTYQWRKDGTAISGATAASLVLTNVQMPDGGSYDVVVCNPLGCTTSSVATLRFIAAPDSFNAGASYKVYAFATQPDGKTLVGGDFSTLGGQTINRLGRLNADGSRDTTFNPATSGTFASVFTLALQTDGKILVGGAFTTLGGQTRNRLGRLNADGTLDTNFNPNANSTVYCVAVQGDGRILVGGDFTSLGGQPRNRLARLNADGTLDTAFNPGASGTVYSLAVQPDQRILVGGYFSTLGGGARTNLGRLDPSGALDSTMALGADSYVYCLAVRPDNTVLVGGSFTKLAGMAQTALGLLNPDGTLRANFNPRVSATSFPSVLSVSLQADGGILLGGNFISVGGQTRNYLARLKADGTVDAAFNPGANSLVRALAVQADGRILAGGDFTTLGGFSRSYLARLNNTDAASQNLAFADSHFTWSRGGTSPEVWRTSFEGSTNGGDWITLGEGVRSVGGWELSGIDFPANGYLRARGFVVAGQYNGSAAFVETLIGPPLIATQPASRTNNAGTIATFTAQATGTAPLTFQWRRGGVDLDDGGYIFGAHTATLRLNNVLGANAGTYSVIVSNSLGSVTSLVATLTVVDPFISTSPYSGLAHAGQTASFSAMAAGTEPMSYQWRKDGAELVGSTAATFAITNVQWPDRGNYDVIVRSAFGSATSAVATLSVNLVLPDSADPGADGQVMTLALQPDNKILVGGSITSLGGVARTNIGRLNADGSLDPAFNPGADGTVLGLAIQSDGKILLGGYFGTLGGQSCTNIARLNPDGTPDVTFNPGANTTVSFLAVQPDGKILVGGRFTTLAGQTRNYIGRLTASGSLDPGFNPVADNWVHALAVQTDGRILAGGRFTTLGGQSRSSLGRLEADGTLDTSFNPGANNQVHCLAVQADGKILVGGDFTTLAGQTRNYIGRLNPNGTLDTSFNPGASARVSHLAVQTDGGIVAGGSFIFLGGQLRYFLGRISGDGTLDPAFNPNLNGNPWAMALQADGKILVGGSFGLLAGQSRNHIGRLNNNIPATQSLSVDGSGIFWRREGSSPEVVRTSFSFSTNGSVWFDLGAGTRNTNGWRLSNVLVPANATLRVRGFITGGGFTGGTDWFLESTIITGPALIARDFSSGQFGFNILSKSGQGIIIEASTDLVNWIPIQTNAAPLTDVILFSDSESSNFAYRFYRIRLSQQ